MSIIYEALKKVQAKSDSGSPPQPQGSPVGLPGAKVVLKKNTSLLPAVIFIIVLLVLGMIFRVSTPAPVLPLVSSPAEPPAVLPSPLPSVSESLPKTEPLSKPEPLPQLTLNGIVLSADGNIALINEQILKSGDTIEGAVVEEISGNQVVLSCKEQKIVLKAK